VPALAPPPPSGASARSRGASFRAAISSATSGLTRVLSMRSPRLGPSTGGAAHAVPALGDGSPDDFSLAAPAAPPPSGDAGAANGGLRAAPAFSLSAAA
jgi:DNA segregation ATPase FtsK/SpoIIIE, S-DNA-T family